MVSLFSVWYVTDSGISHSLAFGSLVHNMFSVQTNSLYWVLAQFHKPNSLQDCGSGNGDALASLEHSEADGLAVIPDPGLFVGLLPALVHRLAS